MTLRMRLILSNMAMVLVPFALVIVLVFFVSAYMQGNWPPDFVSVVSPSADQRRSLGPGTIQDILLLSQRVLREVNVVAVSAPERLAEPLFFEGLSTEAQGGFGALVVRRGGQILFSTPSLGPPGSWGELPGFADLRRPLSPVDFPKSRFVLVGQTDFRFEDGAGGSAFFFWNREPSRSQISLVGTLVILAFFLVILAESLVLTSLFSRQLLGPLERLRAETARIAEGDLSASGSPRGPSSSTPSFQSRDELTPLFEGFEAMRLKLVEGQTLRERYETNRKEMIANIAHDLRTPITAINGYVQGIQDGVTSTPEQLNQYLDVIAAKSRDLSRMADELFFFSGLDVKAIPYEFQTLDVGAFLDDLWVELSLDYAGVGLWGPRPEFTGAGLKIRADSAKLREVVVNLAENTVKFKRGPQVRWKWTAVAQADVVRIDFQDDGQGISAEALPHVFDRFFRQDGSRNPSIPGTGLGLAIAKLIVEDHGGTIEAASVEGAGTTMSLRFPRLVGEGV